jgi:nucleoside-diphosphate-sugar epimerase
MRILIIGGTGFIGRHVTRMLAERGHELAVFHRGMTFPALPGGVRHFSGDRRSLSSHAPELRAFAPHVVVDVVLSSGSQARTLIDVFRGVAARVVALSSMDVYRACGVLHRLEPGPLEPLPLTEDSALRTALHTYPREQVRMLQQVFGWLDEEYDKIPVERAVLGDPEVSGTILRLPMVYGPGDPLHRFFPILKRIEDGRRLMAFEERHAAFRSPRGYVENVAWAIVQAATSDVAAGRIYNVAEEHAYSELDWARGIAAAAGWQADFVVLPANRAPAHLVMASNLDQHWVADSSRIRRELGYREPVPHEDALRRTIAWERAHPPARIDAGQFDYAGEDAALSRT